MVSVAAEGWEMGGAAGEAEAENGGGRVGVGFKALST